MFSIKSSSTLDISFLKNSKAVNTGTAPSFYFKNPNDPNNMVTDSSDIEINGQVTSRVSIGQIGNSSKLKLTYDRYNPLQNPLN